MSGNHDSERPESSKDDDDVVGVGAGANSESINNQELSSREANYDSNNSNEDGVMVGTDNNGSGGDSDGVVVSEDAGREDMFLDAPEDLVDVRDSPAAFTEAHGGSDGEDAHRTPFQVLDNDMQNDYMVDELERLRALLDKTVNEKESIARECKDEMEMAAKGIANLRDQIRHLMDKQLADQSASQSVHHSHESEQIALHEMINQCYMFLRSVTEEFQDLNRKSTELSVSREVVDSYLSSVQNESAELQFQKDQYIEEAMNRLLTSFAAIVYVGDLSDSSVTGKIAHVEKSVFSLLENYNWFLYQSDQMRQCLTEVRPDLGEQQDYGIIFAAVNDVLLGSRKKEIDFSEKLSYLEIGNNNLMEQLDKHKEMAEVTNAELERLKAELEQERHRYSNTKEKLSMAVTKGKALVQQRDSLKHALADKTSEFERCLTDSEDKTSALKGAEVMKEKLIESQISGALLQEMLLQQDLVLEKLEGVVPHSSMPEELRSDAITDRVRWLVDERNALNGVSLKFHQLADALLSVDIPENYTFPDLESRLGWLIESLYHAKVEVAALQDENGKIKEAAQSESDRLAALSNKFEAIVQKEHQASSENEQMLKILLEASGVTVVDNETFTAPMLVEKCLTMIKERTNTSDESIEVKEEILHKLQVLLYLKDQESVLYELLLDEEIHKQKTEMDKFFSDIKRASEEVAMLKEEKDTLRRDLERSEDKSSLIREKLSMAVKKGKGLVQERENLKKLIDEKNSEIEKLKLELQQKELEIADYKNDSRLSAELQVIAKLEEDLLAVKDQRNQLQTDLLENSKFHHIVTESIDGIVLPDDSSSGGPVEKLQKIAAYLSGCLAAKAYAEKQLDKATIDVEILNTTVSDGHSSIKSLEEALAGAEEKISQLAEEKRELEDGQASLKHKLHRAMQDVDLLAEANAAKILLENALVLAETNKSSLEKKKEEAESARGALEDEVHKARDEIRDLAAKFSEATITIRTLEDTVSHLETKITHLNDENNEAQIGRASVEKELNKLREEVDSSDRKLQASYSTIRSLEEAHTKAENGISQLVNDKKAAEEEISTINAKLNSCMDELAGSHGSLQRRSLEIFDHLKALRLVVEDDTVLPSLRKCFQTKLESLKEMDGLFRDITGQLAAMSLENPSLLEEPSSITKLLSTRIDDVVGVDFDGSAVDAVEGDDIYLYVQKIVDTFHKRKQTTTEKVDCFLSFLNACNASLVQELRVASNKIPPFADKMISMRQKIETDYQALENKVTTLEEDISVLLTACNKATQMLQSKVDQKIPEVDSTHDHEVEYKGKSHSSEHGKVVESLLLSTRKVCSGFELFERSREMHSYSTEELQNNLNETKAIADRAMEERDLYNDKAQMLETDLAALQNLCSELKLSMGNYEDIEATLREKELEISLLQDKLMTKERDAAEALIWASNLKNLQERANRINVSVDSHDWDFELQESIDMKKLVYIIDHFPDLQLQIESLSHEKEDLQTVRATLLRETEHLKQQVQESITLDKELEKVKTKVTDMEAGLDRIIHKFAMSGDVKSVITNDRIERLEKLVATVILESEDLRSRALELESEVEESINNDQELTKLKAQLLDLEAGLRRIILTLRGDITLDEKAVATGDLVHMLEKTVMTVILESENLKSRSHQLDVDVKSTVNEQEFARVKGQLFDLESRLRSIIQKFRGGTNVDQMHVAASDLTQSVENMVMEMTVESENAKSKVRELDSKLLGSQKFVDEVLARVRVLEDSLESRAVPPEKVQERSIFEAPSQSPGSEISEVEDVGTVSKPTNTPVPSSAHVRTKKGSSDHISLNIDSESSRLIDKEAVEKKGHVFKSLNTSGLIPRQGKMVADRIDGIWVSSDRLLRSRPGARLGFVAYWLLLHIWLLGTIL